ncbi:hypothetical protein AYO44_03775 [Planctomycetaceae bacterium SCGC AG-212-F19]|nr:hypothetical protein AYO44_03775 [Planctomycetaceae bacterium SCGC AG-212-F19]
MNKPCGDEAKPTCETCGYPASIQVHDLDRAGIRQETHHYCREHSRPSAILEDFAKPRRCPTCGRPA